MACDNVLPRRRLSVMETDLANRTGQHNYTVDLDSEVFPPPISAIPDTGTATNPLYVVNFNNSKPEKNINITRERLSPRNESGENIYQEPIDLLGR